MRFVKPPYVKPSKLTGYIVQEHLDSKELKIWKDALSVKQKGEDWGKIREKLPEYILEKIGKVMKSARANGFVNPHLKGDELKWKQMIGTEYGLKISCKCDLCEDSFSSGRCKGKVFTNLKGNKEFKPCED